MLADTDDTVLDRDALPSDDGSTFEFEGSLHGNTQVSFIWVDMPPGGRVRLHKHPYKEIFIVQEGTGLYAVGRRTIKAHAGQIVIVPADTPHGFTNVGKGQLREVDIRVSREFITDWLED